MEHNKLDNSELFSNNEILATKLQKVEYTGLKHRQTLRPFDLNFYLPGIFQSLHIY